MIHELMCLRLLHLIILIFDTGGGVGSDDGGHGDNNDNNDANENVNVIQIYIRNYF